MYLKQNYHAIRILGTSQTFASSQCENRRALPAFPTFPLHSPLRLVSLPLLQTNLAQALPSSGAAGPCITWEKHLGRRQPLPHAQGMDKTLGEKNFLQLFVMLCHWGAAVQASL